jgi:hypothetical protein
VFGKRNFPGTAPPSLPAPSPHSKEKCTPLHATTKNTFHFSLNKKKKEEEERKRLQSPFDWLFVRIDEDISLLFGLSEFFVFSLGSDLEERQLLLSGHHGQEIEAEAMCRVWQDGKVASLVSSEEKGCVLL